MTIREFYDREVKALPAGDRFALATMILNDIPAGAVVDEREDWSDEDLRDFAQAGWKRIEETIPEGDSDAAG